MSSLTSPLKIFWEIRGFGTKNGSSEVYQRRTKKIAWGKAIELTKNWPELEKKVLLYQRKVLRNENGAFVDVPCYITEHGYPLQ